LLAVRMSLLELSRATPEFRCSCSMESLVRDRGRTGTLMTRFSKEWWRSLPDAGIGIPTGTPSDALERQYGQLPVTLEAITGSGGRRLFFQARGLDVRNSAWKLGPGLALRGFNPVTATGFRPLIVTDIVVKVNDQLRFDVTLDVGSMLQEVNVVANPVQVQTENTQLGDVVDSKKMLSLPLNGRES